MATTTNNALAAYKDLGYWIGPKVFDDAEVHELRTACAQVLSSKQQPGASPYFLIDDTQPVGGLRRAFNASFVNPRIKKAIENPTLGKLAAQLLDTREVRLWYSQIIEKPGTPANSQSEAKANVGWHQDYRYWQCCESPNMVTAWIALQDTSSVNGAMRVVTGSNKWGLVPIDRGFNSRNLQQLRQSLQTTLAHEWIEHECTLAAGQLSFHHALTLHASGPNASTEPRIGIAIHLMPGTTKRKAGPSCHHSLTFLEPLPQQTECFNTEQWPVIWPL